MNDKFQRDFSEYEKELIKQLREEAESVKDCFTKFSFQALSITSIALGLLARYQPTYPSVGFASVFVVVLSISVMRIGTYKYQTANRHYGFELFLDRVYRLSEAHSAGWKPSYFHFGWEESLRVWRVVQPSIFESLYYTGKLTAYELRVPPLTAGINNSGMKKYKYPWFDASLLMTSEPKKNGVTYRAGNYLRTMMSMLTIIAVCGMISLLFLTLQYLYMLIGGWSSIVQQTGLYLDQKIPLSDLLATYKLPAAFLAGLVVFIMTVSIGTRRIVKNNSRRKLLESGILSIHSCAIMWQIVVTAHHRALERLPGFKNDPPDGPYRVRSLQNYTKVLSEVTDELLEYIPYDKDIYDWLSLPSGSEKIEKRDLPAEV